MTDATAPRDDLAGFLDTGLDLTTDGITEAERKRTLAWYGEHHDHGDLDLAPFARFQLRHDPTTFKRLRRHLLPMGREPDTPLPIAVGVLLFIHTYAALGNGKGTLYEIVAVRRLGATRADVMEIIALAAFHRGPLAVNAVAEVADGYLTDWSVDDGTGIRWPARWAPDVERLRTGIDLSSDRLEEGELDLIRGWYRATTGDVPRHVELLGRIAPDSTFGGNQASLAAGIACLEQLTPELHAGIQATGDRARAGIDALGGAYGVPLHSTGLGHLLGMHWTPERVVDYPTRMRSDRTKIVNLHLALMNQGYYQMSLGYFLLSSEVGADEIDGFLAALERALHTLGYVA